VWTVESAGAWQVWVGNTGPALDEARLAALTQGTERAADGRLGLGLWITARILHTVGGRLRPARADDGFGTVLVAEFDTSPDAAAVASADAATAA
jgi:C4-dicarboxylate-specific signal transduction histidine kinase